MAVYKSKKVTKDGRSYFFRIKYKDIMGTDIDYTSPKYKLKKDAEKAEAEYKLKVGERDINRINPTIDNIYNEWFESYSKKVKKQTAFKTISMYRYLGPIKNIKINDFDTNKYNHYRLYLEKFNFSAHHTNKILGILRNLIKYSNKYYNTSDRILKFIENFKDVNKINNEMDFYTYEEYKIFINRVEDFKWHTFFEILYFLGLRKGEIQALTWKDINFNKGEININKTLTTKIVGEKWSISSPKTKNSNRILPLPNNIINDLKKLKDESMKYKDFQNNWFVFGGPIPFKESTITQKKNYYCDASNLRRIRVHDFRHSCASFLINNGASIMLVSKYLGHSKVSITLDVYSHFYKSELNNITKIINNL